MNTIHHSKIDRAAWAARWPNFPPDEIACRGTGLVPTMDNAAFCAAMDRLQALRKIIGAPLMMNSAYRSPSHNKAVGGAKNSLHMQGIAFDVRMDNHDPGRFIGAAREAGFAGIGTYPRQGFVHIDTGRTRTWGDPFAARATRFAPEAPRHTAAQDAAPAVSTVAATGGIVAALTPLEPALREVAPFLPHAWQSWAIGAAVVIGLAVTLWRVMRRHDPREDQA
jgi:hypothetical protein